MRREGFECTHPALCEVLDVGAVEQTGRVAEVRSEFASEDDGVDVDGGEGRGVGIIGSGQVPEVAGGQPPEFRHPVGRDLTGVEPAEIVEADLPAGVAARRADVSGLQYRSRP